MIQAQEILSPQEVNTYKLQGYTDMEIQKAVNEAESEVNTQQPSVLQQSFQDTQKMMAQDPRKTASQSAFSTQMYDNLIQWQLELDSILERVEHMLKGDKVSFVGGSIVWKPAEDNSGRILNDFGVAEIMRILSLYLNRNTILSNYEEKIINAKMFDLGIEISDLFFLKYEAMGFNSLEKRKLYPILVRELVDVVHSAYLRALNGGERESLRESRMVTQSESLGTMGGGVSINNTMGAKSRSALNPMRWIKGKYV